MTNQATDNNDGEAKTPVAGKEVSLDAAEAMVPVIHDIAPAPVIAQATPKAVAVTAIPDMAVPHTQSLDLAAEVLDYLTDPAIRAPVIRS